MNIETFKKIKAKYGSVASWALWSDTAGADTSDLNVLEGNLNKLHVKTIFVALNISGADRDYPNTFWNFHGGARDYMLRDAIKKTALEGSYITDIIKFHPETNSQKVKRYFKKNPIEFSGHLKYFLKEMAVVGATENTVLIALGNESHELLQKAEIDFPIEKITHYAAPVSKINYRNEVLSLIEKYKL